MTITVMTGGTRGDVQPYVALGTGLKAAGYCVRIAASDDFAALITEAGLEFVSTGESIEAILQSESWRATLERGNFVSILAHMRREMRSRATAQARQLPDLLRDSDLFIAGLAGLGGAFASAAAWGIPTLQAHLFPFTPTSVFPSPLVRYPTLGGPLNRLSFHITRQLFWQSLKTSDAAARAAFGLPKAPFRGPFRSLDRSRAPVLHGYSKYVLPHPSDWPAAHVVTGYWFLDAPSDWTPPADLVDFLAAGEPPIYIGFGSMSGRNPEEAGRIALEALARVGRRGVLASGWGGLKLGDLPPSVYLMASIPHSWLFPRMAAIVHHGGAGTTAAALRAGVPSITVPFMGDQAFWGCQVARLGVGPQPLARKNLTSAQLGDAISAALGDRAMQRRAAELGSNIQGEDGIGAAVTIIERFITHQSIA